MPCNDLSGICKFTVLDLHKYHQLDMLKLDTSSISGLLLPKQDRLKITDLDLKNLVLSHYSLEQLCISMSSSSCICELNVNNLSCSDHGSSCFVPFLVLPNPELHYQGIEESSVTNSSDDTISDSEGND